MPYQTFNSNSLIYTKANITGKQRSNKLKTTLIILSLLVALFILGQLLAYLNFGYIPVLHF